MRATVGEWTVLVSEDFMRDGYRVRMVRRHGPEDCRELTGWDEFGHPILQAAEPYASPSTPLGVLIPDDALMAIVEAVKPGPAQGELKRLEDALATEQARVERLIDASLAPRVKKVPIVFDGSLSPETVDSIMKAMSDARKTVGR